METQAKQGCYYSNEALTFSASVRLKIMNHRVIGIQVLFLIWHDRAGDQRGSEIRCMIRGCMRMSAAVIPMQSAARGGGRPER